MDVNNIIRAEIKSFKEELTELRRDFHAHPELGFQEERTSKKIEEYLENLGIKTKKIAKTGVIGTIEGSGDGPTIGLRADMDALPLTEETGVDYKSTNEGCMHACGHDGHMAIMLVAAKYLSQKRDQLKGNVRLIFQPAEEGFGGAIPMIKEGCLDSPTVDKVLGLHLWSRLELGKVNIIEGPVMAASTKIDVEIIGKSGHGAIPEQTIDPVVVAAQFITSVQTIISRNLNPLESGVISFGKIEGGSNFNIIAPKVSIKGTARAMTSQNMEVIKKRIKDLLDGVCHSFGIEYSLNFSKGYPVLNNNKDLADKMAGLAKTMLGDENIFRKQTMTGEDFAFYAEKVPSLFMFVGSSNMDKKIFYPQHHSKFNIDEDSLMVGLDLVMRFCEDELAL